MNFFFAFFYYMLSCIICIFLFQDMIIKGFITQPTIIAIIISSILACSELDSIFNYNSKYNILSSVISTHSGPFVYFLGSVIFVFIAMTLIFYEFYSSLDEFDSLLDCFNILIAITFADALKEIINFVDECFGKFLIYFCLVLFNLTFLSVVLGIVTVGFQRAKIEFLEKEKI